jgi:divalent metal cation (Fe/Co/Zn/Cd) transporter
MAMFYNKIGTKINNMAIKAASQDSRNDVLATGISLALRLFCRSLSRAFHSMGLPV